MCKCIEVINAQLAKHNAACETNLLATPPRALIALYRLKPRGKKPPHLEAAYCPFCGRLYPKRKRDMSKLFSVTT